MRSYLFVFSLTVSLTVGAVILLALIFLPLEGDLTRLGGYSELDFGWRAPQPSIKIVGSGESIIKKPDVLVLGDSFSAENIWQSVLASKTGTRFLTFQFEKVGCIDNWIDFALNQSSAKIIVIETVERHFVSNFSILSKCKPEIPVPSEIAATTTLPTRKIWPPEWPTKQTLVAAKNTANMIFRNREAIRGDIVINAPIDPSCAKFSNRRSDRILYYRPDEDRFQWSSEDQKHSVNNVLIIQHMLAKHGKKLVFVIVPDKLSVYQDCLIGVKSVGPTEQLNITNTLIRAGVNTPDLLSPFKENVGIIVDLYKPNNTHLSQSGYVLMATNLEPYLSKSQ